jgi:N-acylglucosamine 2-epimerase
MKRRTFLGASAGSAALGAALATPGIAGAAPATQRTTASDGKLAGLTLAGLRDQYRSEFDEFVEFFDKYVVDHEYGGFLCATDHDGKHFDENKSASTEGRGIWCYSFMYNNGLVKDGKYLDYAKRSIDLLMKHRPSGTDYWPSTYSRTGEVLEPKGGLPGDCYIGEGLAEFARATGEKKYADLGRETMLKCLAHYDRPDFKDGTTPFPGARNLWYWMLFMWFGINWNMKTPDSDIQKIVDRSIDAMMNYHNNPEFNLWNLDINHDLTRPSGENEKHARLAGCGHATEATWMILYEAVRRKDRKLFDRAAAVYRRHALVSWDKVYGGVYNDCEDVDANKWGLEKIFWAQAFILINAFVVVEHSGADWAKDMLAEQFDYVETKCRLKRWGFPLMMDSGDRKMSALPKASRKDIYHHPRYLMLCLLSAERMAKRGGKVSGVFV